METEHRVVVGDARSLSEVADDTIDLVVTSPPYPMIEMWDDVFTTLDPAIGNALSAGNGDHAFELMHDVLETVWDEITRVLAPGGLACINVGDATRSVDGEFRLWPNHTEITSRLRDCGLSSLPDILWRKPTNSPNKFMGSGTIPTNAYPTLEHEHVLLFRNGSTRSFPPGDDRRYESAYFWEERNEWFSDLWDLTGTDQAMADGLRDRSGAFPLAVPLRLIAMFSTYGDTVLDPFWGTGTTSLAAMLTGRSSVGYELDAELRAAFDDRIDDLSEQASDYVRRRLDQHRAFVTRRRADGKTLSYEAEHYDFPVVTKQERQIRLYRATGWDRETDDGERVRYTVTYEPY